MSKEGIETKYDLEEIKEELNDHINKQVRKEINEELDKTTRRLIREKNKKIIFRNIVIILLLCVIYYLFYLLYSNNYFTKYNIGKPELPKEEIVEKKEETTEKTLDELKNQYEHLIDNIYLNDKSEYINDFYEGNLSDEIKSYITLNTMNLDDNNSITIIEEEKFKDSYDKLFNDYKTVDFNYNDKEVNYIEKIKSYMINSKFEKNTTRIKKEIIDIKENDNIEITTKEAVYKHDKVYNILTNEEIKDDDNYNKVTYIFNNNKLIEIKKVN